MALARPTGLVAACGPSVVKPIHRRLALGRTGPFGATSSTGWIGVLVGHGWAGRRERGEAREEKGRVKEDDGK
jgi:hypothetical protein